MTASMISTGMLTREMVSRTDAGSGAASHAWDNSRRRAMPLVLWINSANCQN